jgi:hypothetical protein
VARHGTGSGMDGSAGSVVEVQTDVAEWAGPGPRPMAPWGSRSPARSQPPAMQKPYDADRTAGVERQRQHTNEPRWQSAGAAKERGHKRRG